MFRNVKCRHSPSNRTDPLWTLGTGIVCTCNGNSWLLLVVVNPDRLIGRLSCGNGRYFQTFSPLLYSSVQVLISMWFSNIGASFEAFDAIILSPSPHNRWITNMTTIPFRTAHCFKSVSSAPPPSKSISEGSKWTHNLMLVCTVNHEFCANLYFEIQKREAWVGAPPMPEIRVKSRFIILLNLVPAPWNFLLSAPSHLDRVGMRNRLLILCYFETSYWLPFREIRFTQFEVLAPNENRSSKWAYNFVLILYQ